MQRKKISEAEQVCIQLFQRKKVEGWIHQPKHCQGNPDFIFPVTSIAIFIDGCFWHGCLRCYIRPKTNAYYWRTLLRRRRSRDQEVTTNLSGEGWKVIRIWEHETRANGDRWAQTILKLIETGKHAADYRIQRA